MTGWKKIFLVLSSFFVLALKSQASKNNPNSDTISNTKENNLLILYTWGLQKIYIDDSFYECRAEVAKSFGFKRETKAGCVITSSQKRHWIRHNRRIKRKLKKINGKDWGTKYDIAEKKCIKT
jgi:hypothetical protein